MKQQGLEEASRPKPALVTVKDAVSRFLTSKRNENLADSTLDKLTTIFEKQFLAWATSYEFVHITEITTADLEGCRDTWTDGPLAKKKKQEALPMLKLASRDCPRAFIESTAAIAELIVQH